LAEDGVVGREEEDPVSRWEGVMEPLPALLMPDPPDEWSGAEGDVDAEVGVANVAVDDDKAGRYDDGARKEGTGDGCRPPLPLEASSIAGDGKSIDGSSPPLYCDELWRVDAAGGCRCWSEAVRSEAPWFDAMVWVDMSNCCCGGWWACCGGD
jgi:hypothetical protein